MQREIEEVLCEIEEQLNTYISDNFGEYDENLENPSDNLLVRLKNILVVIERMI